MIQIRILGAYEIAKHFGGFFYQAAFFILLKLFYTAKTLACMPNTLLGKVRTVLKLEGELLSKMPDEGMGEWSGYPLHCYEYYRASQKTHFQKAAGPTLHCLNHQ